MGGMECSSQELGRELQEEPEADSAVGSPWDSSAAARHGVAASLWSSRSDSEREISFSPDSEGGCLSRIALLECVHTCTCTAVHVCVYHGVFYDFKMK